MDARGLPMEIKHQVDSVTMTVIMTAVEHLGIEPISLADFKMYLFVLEHHLAVRIGGNRNVYPGNPPLLLPVYVERYELTRNQP